MLATLTLAALSLVPAQPGGLDLINKRMTYGPLGQERKDKQFIVGDVFCLAFDIEGLKAEDDGTVKYSVGMKVDDATGKMQFEQEPRDQAAINSLGGSRTPANAVVELRTDTKPGKYTITVTVTDLLTKAKKSLTHEFEVVAARLGVVQTHLSYAPTGLPAPPIAVVGQAYFVNYAVTGMKLDPKGQPNISVELRVLDETGKATLTKNPTGDVKQAPEELKKILPFQFALQLNRPGTYRVMFKVTDNNDGSKVAEQTLNFTVYDQK